MKIETVMEVKSIERQGDGTISVMLTAGLINSSVERIMIRIPLLAGPPLINARVRVTLEYP